MPLTPLFVDTFDNLVAALRLTGHSDSAVALIDDGVRHARLRFWRRLGKARVDVLVAFTADDTPEDTNEFLRLQARVTEVKIVRRFLYETMPVLFLDASGQRDEVWNTESAFRQGKPSAAVLKGMDDEIDQDMEILAGEREPTEEVETMQVADLEPDNAPPRPGDSLFFGTDVAEESMVDLLTQEDEEA